MELQRSERTRRPTTRYSSEELMPVKKRKIEHTSFDEDDDEDATALLSKFMASPPLTSASSPFAFRASKSKPWVCYICGHATTNKKDMRGHFRQIHGLNADDTRMKWTDVSQGTPKAQNFVIVPSVREVKPAVRAVGAVPAPYSSETPGVEQGQEKASGRGEEQELGEHIRNNAKVIFFSRTQTPRVRLFAACDAPHKMFAQATAGGVFPENTQECWPLKSTIKKVNCPLLRTTRKISTTFSSS